MGNFDAFADAPGQIKREGETITLSFLPGVPANGQGTVKWGIPTPTNGCQSDSPGAYCGIVVTLNNSPQQISNIPVDGTYYVADPTVDADKHAGDTIGSALVVGAFYEGEKKAQGLALTTSFVLSDVISNTSYYLAAYAVDCQGRYHHDGVRSFSDNYGNVDAPDSPSTQVIQMNAGQGVLLSDGTNLVPGNIYEFDIEVNENFPTAGTPQDVINVKVDGTDSQTYQSLIDAINAQLALAENPVQSPVPPNFGSYFWNAGSNTLSQFDGENYSTVSSLVEPTDPSIVTPGTYWFNNDTNLLQIRDIPIPGWNPLTYVNYHKDPVLANCDDYWLNSPTAYRHNGSSWCEQSTVISATDPSLALIGSCGLYWYDTTEDGLFAWNVDQETFASTTAIFWNEQPNNLSVGTYWFDLTTNKLFIRGVGVWTEITNTVISLTEPTTPTASQFWFNPETEELAEYNISTLLFEPRDSLVLFVDPTIVASCDLWWDSVSDNLFTWDVVNSEWDQVVTFIQQEINPLLPPTIPTETVWHDTINNILYSWDGTQWNSVTFISLATDPTLPLLNDVWFDSATSLWYVRDNPIAGWNEINPIDSLTDPTLLAQSTFWYDTTLNVLSQRIGVAWIPVPFTTQPISIPVGQTWFDSTNTTLKEWDGSAYVLSKPKVMIGLNGNGDIVFQSRSTGSCACTMLLVPGGNQQTNSGFADFHSYGHYNSYSESSFDAPPLPNTNVTPEAFLFNSLPGQILAQVYGVDGLPGEPMYDIVGVGSDGTPDERRELADSMRAQLGHPVVEVELTPYQMDEAITSAIESLRKRSDIAYKRGFYFLDIEPGVQQYRLTNKKAGFNKIVGIMAAHRFTSAFLSSTHGSGVYGQVVLQHLYNMGTYDLTSFHLVSQYVEQMEHLFATRLTFNWDESSRLLFLHKSFVHPERILMDCYVERTEQEMLKDRWCKTWIEKFALAQCRLILSEIRGKFASLPGAGGGIALNAQELATRAELDMADCYQQIDDFVASNVEDFGLGTTIVIG